ncbi:hypothetical protein [Nitratireductor sp. StC3]|uniref:hypothetical protein n=1 Tax=Nitratireductor sp. StC3 TaxID=2126741 RepID=UPI000D0DC5DA|nr:hypothetical protein [Nitratireductor sp. StC3]PSM18250.1 hypothetical protein C7T96_10300 [Nitratireductor sp. StC3]
MSTATEAALQKSIDALMSLAGFGPEIKKLIGEEGWLQLAYAVQASRAALEAMKEDHASEMLKALVEARRFVADELRSTLECCCVLEKGTLEPIRATIDPRDARHVEEIEAALARIDAAISKATGGA